jgi:glycosyltransferase involved in cell wall biosynthesis
MNRPIRILRVIARLNIGGPAIQAITLSSELSRDQYQTLLVCGSLSPGEGDMTYLALDKGVHRFIIKELGRNISLLDDLKSLFIIRKIIKRFKPDILHTHTAKAGTLGRLAALSLRAPILRSKKIRVFHTFHGHTFHSYFNRLKTFIFILVERLLARFSDRIIVVSEQQKKDVCDIFKIAPEKKVQVIRLGFDLSAYEKIAPNRKASSPAIGSCKNSEPFRVGIVGRLTAVKNHIMLFEAINYLRMWTKIDSFQFIIVGDGELKTELVAEANKLNLSETIIFSGWRKNMPAVYAQLDAVVLTSKNEGTPVAIIEAMAASRPVVATAVGGVPDLIGSVIEEKPEGFQLAQRGLIVPSENANALAGALLFLLENRKEMEPMIRHAKKFVFADYCLQSLLNNIRRLYETPTFEETNQR